MITRVLPSILAGALSLAAAPSAFSVTLLFDLGSGGTPTAAPTNNITDAQAPIANATDTAGNSTSISVTTSGFNGSNTTGTLAPTGSAGAIFSTTYTQDSLYGNTGVFNNVSRPVATMVFSGLDGSGATVYTFDFFASRTGVSDIRETEYNLAGAGSPSSVFLDASNNTSNVVTSAGIIPTAGGTITLTVDAGPNNNNGTGTDPTRFYYLGALRVTTAPVPEPSIFGLLVLSGAALMRRRRTTC